MGFVPRSTKAQGRRLAISAPSAREAEAAIGARRVRVCGAKRSFATLGLAEDEVRRAAYPLRAYECPDCDGWHLTTAKKGNSS